MVHGMWTIDDDDVVDLGEVGWVGGLGRRHVWKPERIEVLVDELNGGNFCLRINLLFATNCEGLVDFWSSNFLA